MDPSYDQVRYPGRPLAQTHPDRLATTAGLFGLVAAPPDHCRVLELGCADGGNLIPMALCLSRSEFLGIDLAERAIARGRTVVSALGLRNLSLLQMDLMDAGRELGEFDYIIAHGVYSWTPPEVRDRLLNICATNLAPHGVAYVSYNTQPGFHRRQMFREMMLHHVENVNEPAARVRQAAELIETLAERQSERDLTSFLFKEELSHIAESEQWYLYHDDLAPSNYAPQFHEFMEQAERHRLSYLGEADFFEMQDDIYPESVKTMLRQFAGDDVILKEQYLDFIKGRRFRQTLLCHEHVALDRGLRPGRMIPLYIASDAQPVSRENDLEEFRGPRGATLRTDYAPAKSALRRLSGIWPQALPFPELLAEAGGDAAPLAEILLQGYRCGLLEVYTLPRPFAAQAGERPAASPLARFEAQDGTLVTTLKHTSVELEDTADRCLLMLMDGTRDGAALFHDLRSISRDGITEDSMEMRIGRLVKQALLLS
jgi:SAM-dependent methyltransferase